MSSDDGSSSKSSDFPSQRRQVQPSIGAEDPTPPPGQNPFREDEPTQPPQPFGPDDPTPPPSTTSIPDTSTSTSSTHDAEHITSTGFIPNETFRTQAVEGPDKGGKKRGAGRTIDFGSFSISLPTFTWLDGADTVERLLYAGGGLLAGALIGGLLGIINALLQGWAIADGVVQIFALALLMGLVGAVMSAMRPRRIDELLERVGISDD